MRRICFSINLDNTARSVNWVILMNPHLVEANTSVCRKHNQLLAVFNYLCISGCGYDINQWRLKVNHCSATFYHVNEHTNPKEFSSSVNTHQLQQIINHIYGHSSVSRCWQQPHVVTASFQFQFLRCWKNPLRNNAIALAVAWIEVRKFIRATTVYNLVTVSRFNCSQIFYTRRLFPTQPYQPQIP